MKILQIIGPINDGGVSAIVYSYLSHMDFTDLKIDILAFEIEDVQNQQFDKPFADLGCKIEYVKHRNNGYISHFTKYNKFILANKYDAVHCHFGLWSMPYLWIAKKAGVRVRIAHSHGSVSGYGKIKNFALQIMRPWLYSCTTQRMACGIKAGDYLWGDLPFQVINNAINLNEFKFDKQRRDEIRQNMALVGKTIGFVGRLCPEKNLDFVIEVAKELRTRKIDFVMLVLGDGEMSSHFDACIKGNKLESSVRMLGKRNDVSDIMQALDCLILPSFHEGFPVVAVEAQACGLQVLLSDKISTEVKILESTTFLPIDNSSGIWVDAIMHSKPNNRDHCVEVMRNAGYDIIEQSRKLRDYYTSDALN